MIVLNVLYKCRPGMRDAFLEDIMTEGLDVASRSDEGNIKYDYYVPVDGGYDLLLVEKWKDADSLSRHLQQPHLIRLGELKSQYVADTVFEKYESDS